LNLTGTLPESIGRLVHLRFIGVYRSNLQGTLPTQLCLLTNLFALTMDRNNLTGTLPNCIGQLTNLRYLFINSNYLSGTIPSQLALLSRLKELAITANSFTGTYPSQLSTLPCLYNSHLYNVNVSLPEPPIQLRPDMSVCTAPPLTSPPPTSMMAGTPTPTPTPTPFPSPSNQVTVQGSTLAPVASDTTAISTTTTTNTIASVSNTLNVTTFGFGSMTPVETEGIMSSASLPDWEIAVIVLGALFALIVIALVAIFVIRRRNSNTSTSQQASATAAMSDTASVSTEYARIVVLPGSTYDFVPVSSQPNYDAGNIEDTREERDFI
jgi:hypothetical protein